MLRWWLLCAALSGSGLGCGGPDAPAAPLARPEARAELAVPALPEVPRLRARADAIGRSFSPERAVAVTEYADRFFRVRGNEGYRKTLERVQTALRAAGVTERLVEMGPRRATWTPRAARLALVSADGPRELVAFTSEREPDRAALLVGSSATADAELELIAADAVRGGADARGRVVLAEGEPRARFAELVAPTGAAGLLTHNVEPYHDAEAHPDAAQFGYLPEHSAPAFGFSLSARAHGALTDALARGPARVRVSVEVAVGQGAASAVEARIDGTDPSAGAIVFVAHVDEPGANDNASGVGALAELAVAIHGAIERGDVEPPTRSLVFLWGQEIEVSRTWLRAPPVPVAAGLVMDMVGMDPRLGAPFLIERTPDPGAVWLRGDDAHTEWGATPVRAESLRGHFLNDLSAAAAAETAALYPPWRWRTNPFEGGSDHVPFLDLERPAVLGWHFTDDAYHTTRDRMDRVSGEEMRRVAATFGAVALTLASERRADGREVLAIVERAARARVQDVDAASATLIAEGESDARTEARVRRAWREWYDEALAQIGAHYPTVEVEDARERWRVGAASVDGPAR